MSAATLAPAPDPRRPAVMVELLLARVPCVRAPRRLHPQLPAVVVDREGQPERRWQQLIDCRRAILDRPLLARVSGRPTLGQLILREGISGDRIIAVLTTAARRCR